MATETKVRRASNLVTMATPKFPCQQVEHEAMTERRELLANCRSWKQGNLKSSLAPAARPSPGAAACARLGAAMPKCLKYDKEVYFAERVTSLGKDWYQPCLKCEKCGKTLTSRGHAEHEGKPYCNHSCYAAMFGPKGFGRGGPESHTFK
ncbi:hypothetical protein H8959_020985 [Pygathrix nigripes]